MNVVLWDGEGIGCLLLIVLIVVICAASFVGEGIRSIIPSWIEPACIVAFVLWLLAVVVYKTYEIFNAIRESWASRVVVKKYGSDSVKQRLREGYGDWRAEAKTLLCQRAFNSFDQFGIKQVEGRFDRLKGKDVAEAEFKIMQKVRGILPNCKVYPVEEAKTRRRAVEVKLRSEGILISKVFFREIA